MKGKHTAITATLVAAATLWSGAALAGDQDRFDQLDSNRDGYLTANEAGVQIGMKDRFATFDTDRDGLLSKDEWKAGLQHVRDQEEAE